MDELVGFFGDASPADSTPQPAAAAALPSPDAAFEKRAFKGKRGRRRLSSAAGGVPSAPAAPTRLRNSYSFSGLNQVQAAEELPCVLPPEIEEGNVEYKVRNCLAGGCS